MVMSLSIAATMTKYQSVEHLLNMHNTLGSIPSTRHILYLQFYWVMKR